MSCQDPLYHNLKIKLLVNTLPVNSSSFILVAVHSAKRELLSFAVFKTMTVNTPPVSYNEHIPPDLLLLHFFSSPSLRSASVPPLVVLAAPLPPPRRHRLLVVSDDLRPRQTLHTRLPAEIPVLQPAAPPLRPVTFRGRGRGSSPRLPPPAHVTSHRYLVGVMIRLTGNV